MSQNPTPSRTVALIHGAFVTRHCWDLWVPHYQARGYDCVALAYPGRDRPVAELRADPDVALLRSLKIQDVIEHLAARLAALPEKPIIVGHSFGGLLTQLMIQRGLGVAGVAIGSVPPQGVMTLAWSFIRSLTPVVNPFAGSRPYTMTFPQFQYTFANDLPLPEQRAGYEAEVVPESRPFARGALTRASRIDFRRPHAPLLMIASEKDHIMPASLNRRNCRRYLRGPSVTAYKEFPGRAHYSILAGRGWKEVADYALDWAIEAQGAQRPAAVAEPAR